MNASIPSIVRWAAAGVAMAAMESQAFYTNIVIDGVYTDWAGIPVVATDISGDNDSGPDLASLQMANDDTYLYLHVTYHAAINPNAGPSVFLGLDADDNSGTGFDVFGLGYGSEAGWQNDFPFQQANGNFNSGSISGGGAAIAPFNTITTEQEYAIPLAAVYDAGGGLVFAQDTFKLLVYTDPTAASEAMGPVTYTLSSQVEASAFSSITLGSVVSFVVSNSQPIVSYRLEYNEVLVSTNWVFTGYQAFGNGTNLYLYDATGHTPGKTYRVLGLYP